MTQFITKEDLDIINLALSSGADVKIKTTQSGVKILKEYATVLRKKDENGKEIPR